MQPPREVTPEELERDREAWNLPRPPKAPKTAQAPFSVRSGREDKTESEPEAA
jgi:hypothetical protein